MEDKKETEIDLRVIFAAIKKNIIPIILVAVVFGVTAFLGTKFFIPKQYKASATLIVNNKANNSTTINQNEITAAQNLADVYAIIIKSDTVIQKVIDDLKLNMTYVQLSNAISVSAVNSTQVIEISMQHTDANFANKIIADIVKIAPPILADKVEAGSVKVISEAKIANNGNPVSPNTTKNALIGAVIGLVLMLAVVIIKELFNNTFKSEEDIVNTLNIPLLGVIPNVDVKEFNK
ncbi:MAG: Wzz/FepE/Etk N-terminal domain-containing protein [Clostridia bacterium]|nr:Wzz/FepE/Etk N-terminal domain-containing protein [Clostridia bacterium]